MAIGVFLSSFASNLAVFMLCYSLLFGAGVGLAYTAPMVNGWKWFPDKKGLVSGAVVAGFGAGGFVFNQVRNRPGLAWPGVNLCAEIRCALLVQGTDEIGWGWEAFSSLLTM